MIKIFLLISLIICDFISKQLVFNLINLNNFIPITSFFDIAHIHNFGIAFGFFSGFYPPWIFISIGIIITLLVFLMFTKTKNNIEKWGFIAILSGAISNIMDRIINGFVIDFLYFHYKEFYWPAFNFADIYITVGILILIIQLLNDGRKKVIK